MKGWWRGWAFIRVRGRSMMPALLDGDYVLLRRHRPGRLRVGDIVCFRRPEQGLLIKRIARPAQGGGFHLSGDGAASQPSVDLGILKDEQVEGRAVLRLSGSTISLIRPPPT